MVCAQVMGQHVTVTIAGQSGSFQLNTMLPLVAHSLLSSASLLSNAMRALADQAIAGFTVRRDVIDPALARNPILVTALNPLIGYERAAQIAKQAYSMRQYNEPNCFCLIIMKIKYYFKQILCLIEQDHSKLPLFLL